MGSSKFVGSKVKQRTAEKQTSGFPGESITAGLYFAIYAMFFSFIENSIYYWIPQGEYKIKTYFISFIYYSYRLYYVVSFISVFYTARTFFKSLKTKKESNASQSAPMENDIVPNYTSKLHVKLHLQNYTHGNLLEGQTHDC